MVGGEVQSWYVWLIETRGSESEWCRSGERSRPDRAKWQAAGLARPSSGHKSQESQSLKDDLDHIGFSSKVKLKYARDLKYVWYL